MSKQLPESRNSLFVYGSLMCADIMSRVCGWEGEGTAAVLQGYRRCRVKRANYPGILADPLARVEGVLYQDIPASAWARLDRFEGSLYRRQTITVSTRLDRNIAAQTYVISPDCIDQLEPDGWDFDEFLKNEKAAFMADCGFDEET